MRNEVADEIQKNKVLITHQKSGWCDRNVAIEYLNWLRKYNGEKELVLVWDVYSAHRDPLVKEKAIELGIKLIFIPPGMTGTLQPLDRRIFGSLKARGKARWARSLSGQLTKFDSLRFMLMAWDAISQREVWKAWFGDGKQKTREE
jgi:hypothetical protein